MVIVNFGHPLTPAQLDAIAGATQPAECVIAIPTQFDPSQPFVSQARVLVDSVGLTPEEWQTRPILVNLPTLHVVAALVLAELHGRMGYFPAVLRLRPVEGSLPPRFEFAEILNLQGMRDEARRLR